MEKIALKQFEEQWRILFHRDASLIVPPTEAAAAKPTAPTQGDAADDEAGDPFDCSTLAIPPTHVLVDTVADEFVQRWKALDERKIAALPSGTEQNEEPQAVRAAAAAPEEDGELVDGEDEHSSRSNQRKPKRRRNSSLPTWYDKHIRLPQGFDYATKQNAPPPDDFTDRVVSLEDPTVTLSYHTELWKLFAEIPSDQTLEDEAVAGCNLPNTKRLCDEIAEIQNDRESCYTTDGHALSRFRMNDRHDLPPPEGIDPRKFSAMSDFCSTLRFEFFHQHMKRLSSPDSNRMVLEFLGTQTLLDVHRALVELTEDELWEEAEKKATSTVTGATEKASTSCSSCESSGFFFIEGIFYTAGSVDYVKPIHEWMKTGKKEGQTRRLRVHLGLTNYETLPPIRSMKNTRLEDISCRLALRYVHVMHGDVECSVFATDRRLLTKKGAADLQFPIIHDIWSPSHPLPECEACQSRPGCIATASTCEITGGHRLLCEDCCRQLQLPIKACDQIKRYSEWRSQADISAGAMLEKYF